MSNMACLMERSSDRTLATTAPHSKASGIDSLSIAASGVLRVPLALLAATLVTALGVRASLLTTSGALAAVAVGTALVGFGGWWTGLLIVVFFASSSALSRLSREIQPQIRAAKGERRDMVQVLANGGVPALCAMGAGLAQDPSPWLAAAGGGVAAACADTWATEIGRTSAAPPRMITTWRRAASGSSGAVSAKGTFGALLGAAVIALAAASGTAMDWWLPDRSVVAVLAAVTVAGFAGALTDSLLGATVQAQYWCPRCRAPTEQPVHHCGIHATLIRGVPFVTNDVVNALSIAAAAALAWFMSPWP